MIDQAGKRGVRRTRVLVAGTAAALLVALSLAGCGSSKPAARAKSTTVATANTLTVVAYDDPTMGYHISGTPHPGMVTMSFENQGDETHEMSLVRFKPGVTLDQLKAALKKTNAEQAGDALMIDPDAEITGPQLLGPGMKETVTAPLVAGHYVVICFLPGKDGMPHAMMGMIGEFTVAGAAEDVVPATTGTVSLTDHGITLPAGFSGGGTFAVTNSGTKPHDFTLAQLKGQPLATFFQCVGGNLGNGKPIGTCPGTLIGGVGQLKAGQTAYLTLHPAAGTYGYVSTQGNGTDFMAGLQGTFVVK